MPRVDPPQQRRELAFEKAVLARLEPLSAKLTAVLKKLIAHDYPADFWQLDFEVQDQGAFEEGFPVQVYYYRKGYDQIMEGDDGWEEYPTKVPDSLLKVRNIYPSSLVRQHSESEDDDWHDSVATRAFIPWFQACWKRAGGAKFSRRAAIASHDTAKRLDLRTGKWRKM